MIQLKIPKPARTCVGCGETLGVQALSPLLYRKGRNAKGILRTGRRVLVCDNCLSVLIAFGATGAAQRSVLTMFRESLGNLYKGILEDQSE